MSRSGGFWAGVVFGGAALGAVIATAYFVSTNEPVTHDDLCFVTDAEGETYARTSEAANNAALVAAVGHRRGLSTYASTIGVATAIQESGLRNLDYGDRDSLGLFQQRPSQGWGTIEEVTDPHYASLAFYWRLKKTDGWEDMRVTDAAQAVQRSGFPEAYQDHADEGAAWAEAIRGDTPFAAVDCDLAAVTEPNTAAALAERISKDFGDDAYTVAVLAKNDKATLLGIQATSGEPKELDGLANWGVAVAAEQSIASVRLGDTQWLREQGVSPNTGIDEFDGVLIGVVTSVPTD
ncbi:hypothetical protein [Demequina sp.]|uniref:hypothetical protein n=1 Tax=Demequina sp. TaxID=2050685 RepID=UPI003D0AC82C